MVYVFLIASYFIGIFTFLLVRKKNIRSILSFQKNKKNITFSNLIKKHNSYAMWLVFGIILFWVYTQGVYFLAEKHIAIDDFNAVRIAQNLVGVLSIIFVTFENIMLTKTVAIFNGKDFKKLDSFVKTVLKKNLVAFIFIVLIIALVTSFIYKIYYQNDAFYSGKIIYLLYFFIYQFIFGLSRIFVVALKAMNQTKYVFYNHLLTALIIFVSSLFLFKRINSSGHTIAIIITLSIFIFSLGIYTSYKKVISKNK
jgi:Na+-driven multidrug efflux pump